MSWPLNFGFMYLLMRSQSASVFGAAGTSVPVECNLEKMF